MEIWDGTSATRADMGVRKAPDGDDWKVLVRHVQETQRFALNLAENARDMPSLVSEILSRKKELDALHRDIVKLTAPEDVKKQVETLRVRLDEMHAVYKHAAEVLDAVQLLQVQLINLNAQMKEHVAENKRQRTSFENKAAHRQQVNEKRWADRLATVEAELTTVSLALNLKTFGEQRGP